MKIAIASDLHYDPRGYLTPPEEIQSLAARIAAKEPDAVILAGDISHGARPFEDCIACFREVGAPVAVLAGNHDLWRDDQDGHSSEELWGRLLREATERQGAIWLEQENLRFGPVGIAGTLAWYDYSAIDPQFSHSHEEIALLKSRLNNDAVWINWEKSDRAFAAELARHFLARLEDLSGDASIQSILVVTHVPLLEEQIVRRPEDPQWSFSNAYFGNLTLGYEVLKVPKVRAVVSGHTHFGRQATVRREGMPSVEAYVVQSDYGEPGYLMLEW